MTTTINISLPKSLHADAKKAVAGKGYTSISELFRDALRRFLYPELTENGFTSEFEEEVLQIANDSNQEYIEWDGKTPFSQFVMNYPLKNHREQKHG
ncbi:hypothetical protein HYW46_06625 [Candidatus Daviesbacteria bacterium]|nr:hypothetical protein [Candidatus Daviesbacteria bacterium]